jgi:membrane-bound lytic murein transglycosylase D
MATATNHNLINCIECSEKRFSPKPTPNIFYIVNSKQLFTGKLFCQRMQKNIPCADLSAGLSLCASCLKDLIYFKPMKNTLKSPSYFAFLFIFVIGGVALGGCSTAGGRNAHPDTGATGSTNDIWSAVDQIEEEILEADQSIDHNALPLTSVEVPINPAGKRGRIPVEVNALVKKWIHYFSVRDRARFARFLERGETYRELIQQTLKENGVPPEIYYLGLIESGYVTHAKSHARATGPWQFMPFTGKRYGLRIDSYADERRDIMRSTKAAAHYLRDLHNVFQSWYLAMAAYNAGEGRILGAIMRGKSRNYWELVEKRALPPETRSYVPKFLAALLIGRHMDRYGFEANPTQRWPKLDLVTVPGGVSLTALAKATKTSIVDIKKYNAHLLRGYTPPSTSEYGLWLPAHMSSAFSESSENITQLSRKTITHERTTAQSRAKYQASAKRVVHRVRRGEALSVIAQKYGVPLSRIKRTNALRTNRIFAGQRLVIHKNL